MTWKDVNKVTGGNVEANACLAKWSAVLRAVDDIVDNQTYDADKILTALALNIEFCSDLFYRKHSHRLQIPALVATGIWEVSGKWEHENELWKKQWADVLRHADVIFMGAMCVICQGWEASIEFYEEFLIAGRKDHLERHGEAKLPDTITCW